jgi:hypothetical protein
MRRATQFDLHQRLEAYFATARRDASKTPSHWQLYAAATGSALAMLTGASASIVGDGHWVSAEPMRDFLADRQHIGASRNAPSIKAARLAMQRQDSALRSPRERDESSRHFAGRRGASLQHREHNTAWRMGFHLRRQSDQRDGDVEGRFPDLSGKYDGRNQRQGGVPYLTSVPNRSTFRLRTIRPEAW